MPYFDVGVLLDDAFVALSSACSAFLRPYRWSLIVSIVLAVGSQAGRDRDRVPHRQRPAARRSANDEHAALGARRAVLAVGAARALFMVGRRLISGRQALGVEFDMRNALYAKLLRLSFGFYDRHQTGQLMSRATVDLQSRALLPRLRPHLLLPARARRSSASRS